MGQPRSERAKMFWRGLAKWLKISGGVCCCGCLLAEFVLLCYLSSSRPEVPQPERGWTTGLSWTHPPRYGTPLDEARLQVPFDLFFPGFGLMWASALVKIYMLDDYSDIRPRPNPKGVPPALPGRQ
jgi:hypothetical protein